MNYICLFFITLSHNAFSQKSVSETFKKLCFSQAVEKSDSKDVRILIVRPCSWAEFETGEPSIQAGLRYRFNDSTSFISLFGISKSAIKISKEHFSEMLTEKDLKEIVKRNEPAAIFISGRRVNIDGRDWGETVYEVPKGVMPNSKSYTYVLQYILMHNDYVFSMTYGSFSSNEKIAYTLFVKYKELFQSLATQSSITEKLLR